jgi:hypothetical protein
MPGPAAAIAAFDYEAPEHVEHWATLTIARDAIRQEMGRCAKSIIKIGLHLIQAKDECGHGLFLKWLAAEFGWDRTTAWRFMSVGDRFGDQGNVARVQHLEPTTLYLLAGPKTPETVREEVLSRFDAGEKLQVQEVRSLIKEAKEQPYRREKLQKSPEMEDKPEIVAVYEAYARLSSIGRRYVKDVVTPIFFKGE